MTDDARAMSGLWFKWGAAAGLVVATVATAGMLPCVCARAGVPAWRKAAALIVDWLHVLFCISHVGLALYIVAAAMLLRVYRLDALVALVTLTFAYIASFQFYRMCPVTRAFNVLLRLDPCTPFADDLISRFSPGFCDSLASGWKARDCGDNVEFWLRSLFVRSSLLLLVLLAFVPAVVAHRSLVIR